MGSGHGLPRKGLDMADRCKTCKFWVPEHATGYSGICSHIRVGTSQDDPIPSDGLFVGVAEDYPVIVTGPEFGCVHHEEDQDAVIPA